MTARSGLTFIELLIVVAILGVLAAVAVPQLLRSKESANEKAVVGSMHGLVQAQAAHHSQQGEFATLEELRARKYFEISGAIPPAGPGTPANFSKSSYDWQFVVATARRTWNAKAKPKEYDVTGKNCYFIDESGVIRLADGTGGAFTAGPTSPALP